MIATVISRCLYMQDDDAVNAEAFINKASFLVSNSQHEVLNLQYKVQIINWFQGWFNTRLNKAEKFIVLLSFLLLVSCCQVCYARILDLKRKFLEAALRYYNISQIEKRQIGDEYVKLGLYLSWLFGTFMSLFTFSVES